MDGLFCMLAAPEPSAAQKPMTLPRLEGSITLDGRSTEPARQDVEPLSLTMYQPTYKGGIRERTEIRVAYHDEYLYVSGRLYDSNPDGIRANSLYRDRYSGDDTFAIILDAFNDNANALWFFTTPTGVRFDMTVSNDGEGGRPRDDGHDHLPVHRTTERALRLSRHSPVSSKQPLELLVVDLNLNGSHRASALVVGLTRYNLAEGDGFFYPAGSVTQLSGHNRCRSTDRG